MPANNRCPNFLLVASFGCSQSSRVSFRSRCLPPRDRVTNHLSAPLRVRRRLARRWLFWLRHSCLAAVFATLVLLAFQVVFFGHSRSSGTAASSSKEQPTVLVTPMPQRASSVRPPQLSALTAINAPRALLALIAKMVEALTGTVPGPCERPRRRAWQHDPVREMEVHSVAGGLLNELVIPALLWHG
jgi:hypothetical protein